MYKTKWRIFLEIINKQYEKAKKNDEPYQFNMFFLRVTLVSNFVKHIFGLCARKSSSNIEGSLDHALLEYDKQSKSMKLLKVLQDINRKMYIYQNKGQTLELLDLYYLNSLFDIYKPILRTE